VRIPHNPTRQKRLVCFVRQEFPAHHNPERDHPWGQVGAGCHVEVDRAHDTVAELFVDQDPSGLCRTR